MTKDEGAKDNAGSGEKAVVDVIGASVVTVDNGGDVVVVSVEDITGAVVKGAVVEIEVDVLVSVLVTAVAVVVVGAVVEGVLVGEVVSGAPQSGGLSPS